MNKQDVYKYAVIGITAEMQDLEKDIKQGYKFIEQIARGEKVKTPKTVDEIREIITAKQAELQKLEKLKFSLKWENDIE